MILVVMLRYPRRRKIRFYLLVLLLAALSTPSLCFAWGAQGHRVVGELAQQRLSPAAAERVAAITGGLSLWQISTWPDAVRSEDEWSMADTWHYMTVEDDQTLDAVLSRTCSKPPCGVARAIEYFSRVLHGDPRTREHFAEITTAAGVRHYRDSLDLSALAFLVHFVGDIHQPLHVGRGDDRGGNQITAEFFSEERNLHSIWDSGMIEREGLSFTEYTAGLNNEMQGQRSEVEQGDARSWAAEAIELRPSVYRIWGRTSRDSELPQISYEYVHQMRPVLRQRLWASGLRLAGLLNEVLVGE